MHEQGERRVPGRVGKEEVDLLALTGAVSEAQLGILLGLRALAIGRRLARPARENVGVLRHARAIVVFDVIVDRHAIPRPCSNQTLNDRRQRRKQ